MVAAARKRLVVSKALVPVMLVGYLATIYGVFVLAG
jgi:hypothetical protein